VETFQIKRGDTRPALDATLSDSSGELSLAGASVLFVMKKPGCAEPVLKKAASVIDAELCKVRFIFGEGDTDTAGAYSGEFEVTFADGGRWTFPTSGFVPIQIYPDLG
jgi:hypothetical protein